MEDLPQLIFSRKKENIFIARFYSHFTQVNVMLELQELYLKFMYASTAILAVK